MLLRRRDSTPTTGHRQRRVEVPSKLMHSVGNEIGNFGTTVMERDYTRGRVLRKVLRIAGDVLVGFAFLGGILAFFFFVA